MTTKGYRLAIAALSILLTVVLYMAWTQQSELRAIRRILADASMHHVLITPVDGDTGSNILVTVKGPITRTGIFPVAVDMNRPAQEPSHISLSWFGHETDVQLVADGYQPESVHIGVRGTGGIEVRMKKAQPSAGAYR